MMTNIEDKLTTILYRSICPDSLELGDYHLRMVSDANAARIKQHLAECPHCTRELRQLEAYLSQVSSDLENSPIERVKIWIARRIPSIPLAADTAMSLPTFAVRGEENGPLMYQAGDAQLTLEIQEDPEQTENKAILGLVLGVAPVGVMAHLWQAGELITSVMVDNLGNFIISNLAPGDYELILSGPSFEIHVQDLRF